MASLKKSLHNFTYAHLSMTYYIKIHVLTNCSCYYRAVNWPKMIFSGLIYKAFDYILCRPSKNQLTGLLIIML